MLVLLSPAKSMCTYRATQFVTSCPELLEKTDVLLRVMKGKSQGEIKSLMHISDAVSSLNYNRYQCFINNETGDVESAIAASSSQSKSAVSASASASPFKPTALVLDGPAYRSFDASSFNAQQYEFAQKHVRILSGLYGVLKPWDLIQEYRLEMGTKLAVGSVKTLYDYWGETITEKLKADLTAQHCSEKASKLSVEVAVKVSKTKRKKGEEEAEGGGSDRTGVAVGAGVGVQLLVNLASQEYFKSVRTKSLCGVRVVECVFKDKGRVTSVYAKRARGLMARYIVTQGIQGPGSSGGSAGEGSDEESFQRCLQELRGFDLEGYAFQEAQSSDQCIVFNRTCGPPAALALDDEGEGGEGEGGEREGGDGKGKGKKVVKVKAATVSKKGVKKEEIKAELCEDDEVKVEDTVIKAGKKGIRSISLPAGNAPSSTLSGATGSDINTAAPSTTVGRGRGRGRGRLTVPEQEPISVSASASVTVTVTAPPAKRTRVTRTLQ